MSDSAEKVITKYGTIGFVQCNGIVAKKNIVFNDMYWLAEHSILSYIYGYNHSNIIKHNIVHFLNTKSPKERKKKLYYQIEFPFYDKTLNQYKISNDQELLQILIDIVSAIKMLHKLNIWHRDIKPENILIKDNRAIIIDFSHAIRICKQYKIELDAAVVTFSHRAPEVFKYSRDKTCRYSNKIDIWSIGVILFELVTEKMMYSIIGDYHDEQDIDDFFNKQIMFKSLNIIHQEYVCSKQSKYIHYEFYWDLISNMLNYNEERRYTAEELYEKIYSFAEEQNIELIIPTFIDGEYPKHKQEIKNYDNQLYTLCCDLFISFNKLFKLIDSNIAQLILKQMICDGKITNSNYKKQCYTIYVILLNMIYDINIYMDELVETYNSFITDTDKITEKIMQSLIIDLIITYGNDIFVFNKFNIY